VWYYDGENKTIKFIDLSSQQINLDADSIIDSYQNASPPKLISYSKEKDISSTNQKGIISWYERAGEKKSYNCSKGASMVLSALYAADFVGNRQRTTPNGKNFNANADTLGAILKQYHPLLRDAWWARDMYGMTSPQTVAEYLTDFSSGAFISLTGNDDIEYTPGDYIIPEFGDMRILGVVAKDPISNDQFPFQKLVKNQWSQLVKGLNGVEQQRVKDLSGFFVVTYTDTDALQKRFQMEDELFSFIGRFFVREHLFRLCGITGNDEFVKNNTSIETADGSAQILSKKDGISTNPLSRYRYYKDGYLGCCMGTGNVLTDPPANPDPNQSFPQKTQGIDLMDFGGNVKPVDTPQDYSSGDGLQGGLFSMKSSKQHVPKLEQTVVLLEREAKFVPEPGTFQEVFKDYIANKYGNLEWKLYNNDGVPGDFPALKKVFGAESALKSGYAGNIKIFIVYPGNFTINVNWQTTVDHPIDKKATQTRNVKRRVGGKYGQDVFIGLIDNKCHYVDFNDNVLKGFHTPPHTFVPKALNEQLIDKQGNAQAGGAGGSKKICDKILSNSAEVSFRKPAYRVFVTQSFDQEVTLPKIQTGVFSNMDNVTGVRSLEVEENIFTDDDFFAFTGSGLSYGCIPNLNYLSGIHTAYTGNIYSDNTPQENLTIEIKGFPDFTSLDEEIKKGFSSVSLQITDNGTSSVIEYNTKKIKSISKDLLKFANTRRFLTKAR